MNKINEYRIKVHFVNTLYYVKIINAQFFLDDFVTMYARISSDFAHFLLVGQVMLPQ